MPNIRQYINLLYYRRKIPIINHPLSFYSTLMNNNTAFSFARYGDGEWAALLGEHGKNCDGHEYFPAMGEKLRTALIRPSGDYFFGMQNYVVKQAGRQIYRFIRNNNIHISWHQSDLFHHSNAQGLLLPFIEALRKKEVVLIGPAYLQAIDKRLVNASHFIEVPKTNCFLNIDEIEEKILSYAAKHPGAVYALSASMTTNCIIHDCYPIIGQKSWMLDLGSLWDGYLAAGTRSFCTAYDWNLLLKKNAGS